MNFEDKKIILDHIYYDINKQRKNFRLCSTFINKDEKIFTKWTPYLAVQEKDYLVTKVNQREVL